VLGRPGWNGEKDPQPHDALQPDNPRNEHKGDTCFLRDGAVIGRFSFIESVREDAAAMIATLQQRFAVHILSGDRTEKVSAMAAKLRIPQEHVRAELIPQAKADYIDALGGDAVFFVGDGANDALAFSRSGVRATPATPHGLLQDKADCFFTGRSLQCLLDLFAISRLRSRALRAVMAFAILYNCIAVAIALSGHMHPLLAAILMPLSSITTMAIVALVYRS
jgi:Cu2+-exporting ATPase